MQASRPPITSSVHACAIVLGRTGVLLTGASGSGKSSLAVHLIEHWNMHGRHAVWISDDRVHLASKNGRAIARCPKPISGLVEVAHLGLVKVAHQTIGQMDCVITLEPHGDLERMPVDETSASLGITSAPLPVLSVPERNTPLAASLVISWLEERGL